MPTSVDPTQKQARVEVLAGEYRSLAAAATPIQDRMDAIRAELRDLLDYGSHPAAGIKIGVQPNRTFDPDRFANLYPKEQYPQFYKRVPDRKTIDAQFPPDAIRAFQKEGAPKIVVAI
jgi:hypothetical protein